MEKHDENLAVATSERGAKSPPSRHTPGPWSLCRVYEDMWHLNQGNGTGYICDLPCYPHRVTECTANARLIAAAPDLLTALQRLVNDSMFKDHPEASRMAIDA